MRRVDFKLLSSVEMVKALVVSHWTFIIIQDVLCTYLPKGTYYMTAKGVFTMCKLTYYVLAC